MEEKLKNSMRFYMLATQLKYKIRSGWDKSHWNVSKERLESIAEHVYGTCILALSIDSEFKTGLKHFLPLKNKKSIGNALFFCQIFQKNVA